MAGDKMTNREYKEIENYMLLQMKDSAHDEHHVYRVLNSAIDIASYMENIDMDVLIATFVLNPHPYFRPFVNLSS